ncbi:uncharacterized protein DFL_000658 [Arthrobotrys flagrans]|uniref:Uncharacterized protein n=1 Tax=Arthrobotrys flagrans TaxID=97331 RepID=A0A437AFI3_ARTFL|nr:hypothetical protein DFL_000658 [Arthrobotrys flagrans]
MFPLSGTRTAIASPKLLAIIGSIFIAGFVIYQIFFLYDLIFASDLSEPLDALRSCHRHKPTLKHLDASRSTNNPGIPNIIHQIWKTSNISEYAKDPSYRSWKGIYQPKNYTIKLWTDDDIHELIKVKYPSLLSTYEGYPHSIQRADLARLVVVHAEGGVYADLDVYPRAVKELQCLQNLGMQAIFAPTAGTRGVSNHFFMAEKESPFLRWALDEAKRRSGLNSNQIVLPYLRVFWSTGPMMVTAAALEYAAVRGANHRVAVIDDRFIRTLVGHVAGRSWHGLDGQVLNFVADYHKRIALGLGALVSLALIVVVARLVYLRRRRNRIQPEYTDLCQKLSVN